MIGQFKMLLKICHWRENSKRISGNSLSPLGGENKDIRAASQKLPTGVRLRLRRRLGPDGYDQFRFPGNWPPTPPLSQHYHLLLT